MKTLMAIMVALCLTSAAAQTTTSPTDTAHDYVSYPGTPALNHDPVFRKVLQKRLEYPVRASRNGLFTRLFVAFDVDGRGRIVNIVPLLAHPTGADFEAFAEKALRRMPHLQQRYQGHYVLPVAFVLQSRMDPNEKFFPSATLPPGAGRRVLLDEVQVVALAYTQPMQIIE